MSLRRMAIALTLPLYLALAGCDTEEALLKQRLEVLAAEEKALQELLAQLKANPGLEGSGAVSLFLSKDVLNGVLAGLDGLVIAVPDVEGVTVQVNAVRTDFRLGYPLINVDAVAKKNGLDATLALVGTARLETSIESGAPQHLMMRVHVDSLVPRASWGFLDFGIGGFVRDLMQVELTKELRTAGVIRVPVETGIPLGVPAQAMPFAFQGAAGTVTTPALSLQGKATLTQVISLPDGLHVYGKVSM